jgi:glutathione S-transferase
MIDAEMATNAWAMGSSFSMADCAAAPSLFYAKEVLPFGDRHRNLALRSLDGTPVVRASGGGSEAVFRDVPR